MGNTPDYPNPKRLAGLMRAFDVALSGKAHTRVTRQEFCRANAEQQIEALKQIGIDDPPTITYVERPKERRRSLSIFETALHNRDSRRLRAYNEEWIKNNIEQTKTVREADRTAIVEQAQQTTSRGWLFSLVSRAFRG